LYDIGSSAGELTADHARSTALVLEDRFIQQRLAICITLPAKLQAVTMLTKAGEKTIAQPELWGPG
jgi:hypothetical protein